MRRAMATLLGTLAGTALLIGAKYGNGTSATQHDPAPLAGQDGQGQGKGQPGQSQEGCRDVAGDPATIGSPGVGDLAVTIKICGTAVTSASATLSQSNWKANDKAIPTMNTQAVAYHRTDLSQIAYSGATYTAAAYRTSLKSALTKAGI